MAGDLNARVQALLERQVAEGRQLGVQAAVYRYGEQIVNAYAGTMGPKDPRPVGADSLFSSFSTTKGVAATIVHMLADQGLLDYDAPVIKYWPAFGQNGKERITVATALSHQAGLHKMPRPTTLAFATDWEAGLRWIEQATPAYEPGTKTGYHAVTFSWLVGGIIRGACGRHIRDMIVEDIARPLGVEGELYCGIPDGLEDRLTTLKSAGGGGPRAGLAEAPAMPKDHPMFDAMPPDSELNYNDIRVRKACLPASNGHFTANGLAKMYGALANGGEIGGIRLVSPERIPHMQRILTRDRDIVTGMPMRKGIGFMMGGTTNGVSGPQGPRETSFGHAGNGGSVAFADPELGLGVAVTLNLMQQPVPSGGVTMEICELIRGG